MKANQPNKTKRKASNDSSAPSIGITVLVVTVLLVVSVISATLAAAILHDLLMSVAVFIFVLLVLAIVIPYLLLTLGLVSEDSWLQTYVLVLKRIPGLDAVIDAFTKVTKKK